MKDIDWSEQKRQVIQRLTGCSEAEISKAATEIYQDLDGLLYGIEKGVIALIDGTFQYVKRR